MMVTRGEGGWEKCDEGKEGKIKTTILNFYRKNTYFLVFHCHAYINVTGWTIEIQNVDESDEQNVD